LALVLLRIFNILISRGTIFRCKY